MAVLLTQIEGSGSGVKKVPSYIAPDIAADIRRHFASTIRHGKGNFPSSFVTEFPTFALPTGKWYACNLISPCFNDTYFARWYYVLKVVAICRLQEMNDNT